MIKDLASKYKKIKNAHLGGTGSGKSTLLDLLSAVSLPSCGSYLVDGQKIDETNMVSLRQDIAYVPQKLL